MALLCALALSACSSYRGSDALKVAPGSTFAVVPFVNHSNTPLAAENVAAIVGSELRARHINYIAYDNPEEPQDLKSLLDDSYQSKQAQKWLSNVSYSYVVCGSVDEWNYKAGLDGEPVVGITIRVKDKNGAVVYEKTGSRSGFGRESLNLAGQKVVENILSDIAFGN